MDSQKLMNAYYRSYDRFGGDGGIASMLSYKFNCRQDIVYIFLTRLKFENKAHLEKDFSYMLVDLDVPSLGEVMNVFELAVDKYGSAYQLAVSLAFAYGGKYNRYLYQINCALKSKILKVNFLKCFYLIKGLKNEK